MWVVMYFQALRGEDSEPVRLSVSDMVEMLRTISDTPSSFQTGPAWPWVMATLPVRRAVSVCVLQSACSPEGLRNESRAGEERREMCSE